MIKYGDHRGAPSLLVREVEAHPSRFSRVLPLHLRRVPLLYVALAFAAGIAASQWWWRPAALLVTATAGMIALAGVALCRAVRLAPAAVLLSWALLGWTLATLHPAAFPDPSLAGYADGLRRDVLGTVTSLRPLPSPPEATVPDPAGFAEQASDREPVTNAPAFTADLQLRQIERLDPDVSTMVPVAGSARVVLSAADAATLHCGVPVRATVRLFRPREFRDPGAWNYRGWLARQDVSATGTVVPKHMLPQGQATASLECASQRARVWAAGRLRDFTLWQNRLHLPAAARWSGEDAAAWNAMLFGDRAALTHSLRSSFERTGTFHLFVVSGLHIGLVAGAVFWIADRVRFSRLWSAFLTGLISTAYALLTGFGPPVQRALLMTLVFLLTQALWRDRNAMNAIGAAALAMLLLQPQQLQDSSFQMTVLIAITIGGIAVPLLERTLAPFARACRDLQVLRLDRRAQPSVAQFRVTLRWFHTEVTQTLGHFAAEFVLRTVSVALALLAATALAVVTELTMALPMAFYFHRFTALALPANLIVMPLLLPLMLCGTLAFLACLVSYPVALAASGPAALLLHATGFVVKTLASLRVADLRTPGPATAIAMLLAAGIAACLLLLRARHRPLAWAGLGAAVAVAAGSVLIARRPEPPGDLRVVAIDVGQGDSILLVAPGGTSMLIDAGGMVGAEEDPQQAAKQQAFDIGEEVVSPYLWQRGIAQLDVLALTHAHMDHLGGMSAVLRNFHPRELWLSVEAPSRALHALLDEARSQGTVIRFLRGGERTVWHGVLLDVLGPAPAYHAGAAPANNDSLLLRASWGKASALLAGDAESAAEAAMASGAALTPVTLLKVGHHGSLTSSGDAFLNSLKPGYAVISCGRGNRFGHPRAQVLSRLQSRHIATARTDTMGLVEYSLKGDGTVTVAVPPAIP